MTELRNVLISLVLFFILGKVDIEGKVCEEDWFGSSCQFKCRCNDSNCDEIGTCTNGSSCLHGWFGPVCQYADLAVLGEIQVINTTYVGDNLTDGNEDTCDDVSSFKSLTVNWITPYPFSWMRIHLDKSSKESLLDFNIQFRNKSNTEKIWDCANPETSFVSHTAVDLHCDLDVAVDQLIVSWENVKSICSIYISGGRNIALKQKTSSGSYISPYVSSAAVNDKTTWKTDVPNCFQGSSSSSTYWSLDLTWPGFVDRFVFHFPNDLTDTYSLEIYDEKKDILLENTLKKNKIVYTVLSAGVKKAVAMVKIKHNPSGHSCALCEVQLYGDLQCPKRHYGLECDKICNCAKNEDCFVSTGGCPSGCAAGFFGEGCQIGCSNGSYGQDCWETCSKFCDGDGSCDSHTGACNHGCKIGYHGEQCDLSFNLSLQDDGLVFKVALGSVLAVLVVVLGVVFCRRKQICGGSRTTGQETLEYDNPASTKEEAHRYGNFNSHLNDHFVPAIDGNSATETSTDEGNVVDDQYEYVKSDVMKFGHQAMSVHKGVPIYDDVNDSRQKTETGLDRKTREKSGADRENVQKVSSKSMTATKKGKMKNDKSDSTRHKDNIQIYQNY